jgi:hypothetical protein
MGRVADRRFGDAKDGLLSFADPEAPGRYAVSGKEGQDRAGSSPLVAVVEVIARLHLLGPIFAIFAGLFAGKPLYPMTRTVWNRL